MSAKIKEEILNKVEAVQRVHAAEKKFNRWLASDAIEQHMRAVQEAKAAGIGL